MRDFMAPMFKPAAKLSMNGCWPRAKALSKRWSAQSCTIYFAKRTQLSHWSMARTAPLIHALDSFRGHSSEISTDVPKSQILFLESYVGSFAENRVT